MASLTAGAVDGLAYPLAGVLVGPLLVHVSGTEDYSKVAAVVLMSSIGALFNVVGTQGVIFSLARDDIPLKRRSDIITASIFVTACGMVVFSAFLFPIGKYSGIQNIFNRGEIGAATTLSWLLCVLISLDGVYGGALKARRLITLSAIGELIKFSILLTALLLVSRSSTWIGDCYCFIVAVFASAFFKSILAAKAAGLKISRWTGILKEVRYVATINSWQWIFLLANFFFQQADRLILASRLGAKDFAVYNFAWQMSFVLQSATAACLMYILPLATRSSADSAEELRRNYIHDIKFGAVIATALALTSVIAVTILFHSRLMPDALHSGFTLFLTMSIFMYLSSLAVVPYYYLVALGGLSSIALIYICLGALSFATALAMVGRFGATGLAVSKIWSLLTLSCYWFCHVKFRQRNGRPRQSMGAKAAER